MTRLSIGSTFNGFQVYIEKCKVFAYWPGIGFKGEAEMGLERIWGFMEMEMEIGKGLQGTCYGDLVEIFLLSWRERIQQLEEFMGCGKIVWSGWSGGRLNHFVICFETAQGRPFYNFII